MNRIVGALLGVATVWIGGCAPAVDTDPPPEESTLAQAVECRYGAVTITLPKTWSCAKAPVGYTGLSLVDAPVGVMISGSTKIPESTEQDWRKRLTADGPDLLSRHKAESAVRVERRTGYTLYFFEGVDRQDETSIRRDGYIVGKRYGTRFAQERPVKNDQAVNLALEELWKSLKIL